MQETIIYKPLSEQAFEIIKNMIATHKLKPEERIIEEQLAKNINVSRTTVKRALTRLIEIGLLEDKPRKGIYVKKFYLHTILSIFDVREVLEGLAVRTATALINDEQIQKMMELIQMMEDFTERHDFESYLETDVKFHKLIVKASKNTILDQIINKFHIQMNSFNMVYKIGLIRPASETLIEHQSIFNAIEKREADLAEKLIRNHIRATREKIPEKFKNHDL